MSPEQLLAFNAVLAASILSPGPAFVMALRSGVTGGTAAGIATGLGLGLMAAGWTLAALLGLDTIFGLFPWAYGALKLGGAAYLIYLAVQMWRGAKTPLAPGAAPRGQAVLRGVLTNLGNPKSMLFAAAVLVVIFPEPLQAGDILLLTANHFLLEMTFYTALALVLGFPSLRSRYMATKPFFDRLCALLLGALGLKLLLQR